MNAVIAKMFTEILSSVNVEKLQEAIDHFDGIIGVFSQNTDTIIDRFIETAENTVDTTNLNVTDSNGNIVSLKITVNVTDLFNKTDFNLYRLGLSRLETSLLSEYIMLRIKKEINPILDCSLILYGFTGIKFKCRFNEYNWAENDHGDNFSFSCRIKSEVSYNDLEKLYAEWFTKYYTNKKDD